MQINLAVSSVWPIWNLELRCFSGITIIKYGCSFKHHFKCAELPLLSLKTGISLNLNCKHYPSS